MSKKEKEYTLKELTKIAKKHNLFPAPITNLSMYNAYGEQAMKLLKKKKYDIKEAILFKLIQDEVERWELSHPAELVDDEPNSKYKFIHKENND